MGKIIRNGIEFSSTSDTADNINYNNSQSGLTAVTAQEAIDELNENVSTLTNSLSKIGTLKSTEVITQSIASSTWVKLIDLQLDAGNYVIIRRATAIFPASSPTKLIVSDSNSAEGLGHATSYGIGSLGVNSISVGGSNKLISLWVRHDAGTDINVTGWISVIKVSN